MKRILPLIALAGIMMLATSCEEKKAKTDIIATKYVPKRLTAPVKMPVEVSSEVVEWQGQHYDISIERMAVDSLPMVKDERGQKYVDNKITLKIARTDGTKLLHRSFTKASFASYLDDHYRQNALLGSMLYHKVEGNELKFAVSVMMPESDDEFIPLELSVNPQGGIAIVRDTSIDTWGEEETLDDEEETLSDEE